MGDQDIKGFLYAWLGKRKLIPNYEFKPAGNKQRPRFICNVRQIQATGFHISSSAQLFSSAVVVPVRQCATVQIAVRSY